MLRNDESSTEHLGPLPYGLLRRPLPWPYSVTCRSRGFSLGRNALRWYVLRPSAHDSGSNDR